MERELTRWTSQWDMGGDGARVRRELWALLARKAEILSLGDSSIREEQAEELLRSLCYTVSLALEPLEGAAARKRLLSHPLAALYREGEKRLARRLTRARAAYDRVLEGALPLDNLAYRDTPEEPGRLLLRLPPGPVRERHPLHDRLPAGDRGAGGGRGVHRAIPGRVGAGGRLSFALSAGTGGEAIGRPFSGFPGAGGEPVRAGGGGRAGPYAAGGRTPRGCSWTGRGKAACGRWRAAWARRRFGQSCWARRRRSSGGPGRTAHPSGRRRRSWRRGFRCCRRRGWEAYFHCVIALKIRERLFSAFRKGVLREPENPHGFSGRLTDLKVLFPYTSARTGGRKRRSRRQVAGND